MDDPTYVDLQYRTETHLAARRAVWAKGGQEPLRVVLDLLARQRPQRVLEVGCGRGELAAKIALSTGATVVASDLSRRMVSFACQPPVAGLVADVQELPFTNAAFDAVVGAWMLYHVPDLDRGLEEVARVTRRGGAFVCVTNGDGHLDELWQLVGARPPRLKFNRTNGSKLLERHFGLVDRYDIQAEAVFETRDDIVRYLESIGSGRNWIEVPELARPLRVRGEPTVFVAHPRGR